MPVIKVDSYIAAYRIWAGAANPHYMSGRGDNVVATHAIARNILARVQPLAGARVLDIGCGDGTLLKLAAADVNSGVGLVPTAEEHTRLAALTHERNITFAIGLSEDLRQPDGGFDRVIMNGVAPLLRDDDAMLRTLAEIRRVATDNALIWIGEVPSRNELQNKSYGDSILLWLGHVLRFEGLRRFLSAALSMVPVILGRPFLIMPKTHYFISPEKFTGLAERVGLRVQSMYTHEQPTISGETIASASRYNYLLTVA